MSKDAEGKINCKPIRSKIVTLLAEKNELQFAVPGGLIGVGTRECSCLHCGDKPCRKLKTTCSTSCSHRPAIDTW